ncbi:MAG TPA: mannonate dehydratase [Niabella sp.]|nr:mannonate dehydratase [Niabella sp.]HQW14215.1 mannonate dehydratase [Niabella sp.]HQX39951.1 mannonate dehydratase [Niabella sp.]HRB36752.1 mannonate dehydratase [Niabella sp.]HRB43910.1 mannonate dehydratase [Niabella sp.]
MIQTMRWYGDNDTVSLNDIRQSGASGVVTALHQIPVGEVWTMEEIAKRKQKIEGAGLSWDVVESLPVHEDIKKRNGNYKQWIENYKISLANLAANNVRIVTYNFMPVLDWVRTNLDYDTDTGAKCLRFGWTEFITFDVYILKRTGAENDYEELDVKKAKKFFDSLSLNEIEKLKVSCLMGLPGSDGLFTTVQVLELLSEYGDITPEQLQQNLFSFLNEIAPVAEEQGIQMAIHPDDPPYPILGLPRVMSKDEHIQALFDNVPSKNIGLCFCTGSYGARKDNDLLAMLKKYGERVYFLHLRSTQRDEEGNFFEANHLEGNANLVSIIQYVCQLQMEQGRSIPMRPDHGHQMLDDLNKITYPGYSAIGRLKGLAEIRGVEAAIHQLQL